MKDFERFWTHAEDSKMYSKYTINVYVTMNLHGGFLNAKVALCTVYNLLIHRFYFIIIVR